MPDGFDKDGVPIYSDTDGDDIPDFCDPDSDNDTIPDSTEAGPDPTNPQDTDKDSTPDYIDSFDGYTVRFLDEDGTLLSTQQVRHGYAAKAPVASTQDGFIFDGRDKDFSKATSSLDVTAVYRPVAAPSVPPVSSSDTQAPESNDEGAEPTPSVPPVLDPYPQVPESNEESAEPKDAQSTTPAPSASDKAHDSEELASVPVPDSYKEAFLADGFIKAEIAMLGSQTGNPFYRRYLRKCSFVQSRNHGYARLAQHHIGAVCSFCPDRTYHSRSLQMECIRSCRTHKLCGLAAFRSRYGSGLCYPGWLSEAHRLNRCSYADYSDVICSVFRCKRYLGCAAHPHG